ncbi:4-(cytidine 5'-diphospho)-2-C-methyl-D-erythritol kinase [Acidobacteria bacterium AH-259-G07]|nr:4-(cytidine 5'-diphospho)-2-C-methyl-D-erythritol kinase [Acidobacteria bacterium AH-259-G07]
MTGLSVPSFAKINWVLKILGKRTDGYHELRTIYQTIDLGEEIIFERTSGRTIQLEVLGREVATGEKNLLYQAADLLRTTAGLRSGVNMCLKKKVPVGAGLGGGSSNAAMALLTLNHLWGCKLPLKILVQLAAQLGSDVPFFLLGGTALGVGRGEKVLPLPDVLGSQSLVLFHPNFEVSTKKAYALGDWGIYDGRQILTKKTLDTTIQRLRQAVEQRGEGWSFLENDFEDLLFKYYPVLAEAQDSLRQAGCAQVMLCGSGSTLFGLGKTKQVKGKAKAVTQNRSGEFFFCHILSRENYRRILGQSGLLLL